jgi:hypothetical protein
MLKMIRWRQELVVDPGLSVYQWDPLEIGVAADRGRTWIVSNLNRAWSPRPP